jgi:large subunit ribosomal protein L6
MSEETKEQKVELEIPQNVKANLEGVTLTIEGPLGKTSRSFNHTRISVSLEGSKVVFKYTSKNRRIRAIAIAWMNHVKNMIEGVTHGWRYRMKVVYAHFPLKISTKGNELIIENFLGEKFPRKVILPEGVNVKVEESNLILESVDIEKVGQAALSIEMRTKIKNYDPRVFQDGIYIYSKAEHIK